MTQNAIMENLGDQCRQGLAAADIWLLSLKSSVSTKVSKDGRINAAALETEQFAAHGFAWCATYVETLRQLLNWSDALGSEGNFGELEQLIQQIIFGEYLAQLVHGIPMWQGEIVRPSSMGASHDAYDIFRKSVHTITSRGNTPEARARLAELLAEGADSGHFGSLGLDETLNMVRDQFRRFADEEVTPHAHEWHLNNELIPMNVVDQMSEMGVFGLTIPEEFGGLEMGKTAMCVVSEELSRGYIGVGSLGTRSEIAAELIRLGGTDAQKDYWLPKIASGEILPTAVFTEPNTGSDLGSLRTRAVKDGDVYKVTGNKTWITHASRSDIMTMLVRTSDDDKGYRGLSMFLAEKQRGTEEDPFPTPGMTGGEIEVLGYRGMREYELGFDEFEIKAENLLGEQEGNGFKQLMATFESARIQTAARALGVAQNAFEIGLQYATDRVQFGKPIIKFPRVHGKLAFAAAEIMAARQLSYFAAREKDADRRCDFEAGMAKLLAARVAWSTADNALQIHGGNGFALEYQISRVLCDARILNIFEGAGEIQAQVIARRLLEGGN